MPKQSKEQAQTRRNTLGVLIEPKKAQKHSQPVKGKPMNKKKGVLIESPKGNKLTQQAKGWPLKKQKRRLKLKECL